MDEGRNFESPYSGQIRLDKEGNWFYEDEPITHELTVELFSRSVFKDPEGGYRLVVEPEWARIIVEDTPYMVRRVRWAHEKAMLILNDKTVEELSPETLWIGKDNVLYCMVKNNEYPARFLRPAYYELLKNLVEKNKKYFLKIGGQLYPLEERKE
jgi:hypothetical protein